MSNNSKTDQSEITEIKTKKRDIDQKTCNCKTSCSCEEIHERHCKAIKNRYQNKNIL